MLASYGGAPTTDAQMLTQVELMLEPGWRERMDSFAYSGGTWEEFKEKLRTELEIHYPVLCRRVEFMANPARDPQRSRESPIGYSNRVAKMLEVAGMGTRDNFLLSYDSFLVTSILAGLSAATQVEVYKHFATFDIPLRQFNDFLTLVSTADNIKGHRSKVQAVTSKKPTAGRCQKCRSHYHTTANCSFCDYSSCNRWGHARAKCWEDPANNLTRPAKYKPKAAATAGINSVAAVTPSGDTTATIGAVQAISSNSVASINSSGPTP